MNQQGNEEGYTDTNVIYILYLVLLEYLNEACYTTGMQKTQGKQDIFKYLYVQVHVYVSRKKVAKI
jgi:hypothetical protein